MGTLLFTSAVGYSQETPARWCGTAERMNAMLLNPEQALILQQDELIRQQEAMQGVNTPKGTIYTIPIVFHVLHNNGTENVSEAQIFNALEVINRDFRLMNPDTADIIPLFQPIMGDVEIEFALATKDPQGNCFRGYTRTVSALTFEGEDGGAQVDAIRNGNDVYNGNWPSNKYLNVFVVADAGGAGGYTNYPSNFGGTDMSNGIWILDTQFGEIGTSSPSAGRSLTHECGHWFNLRHTWGNSNTPGLASNCNEDDLVSDTPNCRGVSGGCPVNSNECGPIANVQNYMDYALSCQSMFTEGQVTRMRAAATSSVGGRNNLWTAQNLLATGAGAAMTLCEAEFTSNKQSVCAGESVQFTDNSYNAVTGWTWSFPGGTPATSSTQNPLVTYSTPGIYEVTLNATDGSTSDVETKTSFIRVLPASGQLPFLETFEGLTTLNNIPEWERVTQSVNGFQLETTTGHTGTKCAKVANFNQPSGNTDELIGMPLDLTNISELTMTFRYAYRRQNASDDDWLRVFVTNDCGDSWAVRKTLHGAQISSQIFSSSYKPTTQAEWVTVHMTNITNTYWVDNFRYKFAFEAGDGNNIYLDNINIYAGAPSDNLVADLEESSVFSDFTLYPNPADEELTVQFSLPNAQNLQIVLMDISGKVLRTHSIQANEGLNQVFLATDEFSSGMYFLEARGAGISKRSNFVVR